MLKQLVLLYTSKHREPPTIVLIEQPVKVSDIVVAFSAAISPPGSRESLECELESEFNERYNPNVDVACVLWRCFRSMDRILRVTSHPRRSSQSHKSH